MKLTVRDALKLDAFRSATLLAGNIGLDRCIEKVSILDSPDISNWVSGNELIVTNAYVLQTEATSKDQIFNGLIEKGCSAMAIKLGRYINTIPQNILDLADEKGFPIISLPFDVTWTDIINEVLTKILNMRYHLLQQSEAVRDLYMREVFYETGYDGICNSLAQSQGATVSICDGYGNILSTAIRGDDYACPKEIKEMILKNKSKRIVNGYSGKSGDCRLLPIIVRNERIGYFYSKRSPGELSYIQRCHIDHATTAAALKMLKQKTNEMTENRVKMQLVNEVIFSKAGAMESVRALAGSYGWDINMDAAAVIFKKAGIEKAKGERQNEALYHYVDQYIAGREGLFAVNLNNNVLMFIACDDHSKPKMLDEIKLICGYLNENMPEFHQYKVGIGQICSGYHNYDTSYYQAMDAIAIGQVVLPGNAIYDIDDLIMYRILWNYDNATELEKFVENTIGRLINKDDESLKLINTLEKYLENKSVRQTAEQLYIHNNTAVYRLNKIKNILGTDLEEPEACLNLITAIKIYKYLQAPGREKGN